MPNGLSYCCTMKGYMERILHQTVANDHDANNGNEHRGVG